MATCNQPRSDTRCRRRSLETRQQQASQRQTTQKSREHGAKGIGGIANEEGERPRPQDFIGQRGKAGEGKAAEHKVYGRRIVDGHRMVML